MTVIHFTLAALAAALLTSMSATSLAAREIAITLDDLPYVLPSRTSPSEGLAQVEAVTEASVYANLGDRLANGGVRAWIVDVINKTARAALIFAGVKCERYSEPLSRLKVPLAQLWRRSA